MRRDDSFTRLYYSSSWQILPRKREGCGTYRYSYKQIHFRILRVLGAKVTTWKVGHAYAKTKLREIKGIFGGELAGHYYFRDFNHCDSGMVAALIVLQVVAKLKKEGTTLSSFMDSVISYANSGEQNFKLEQKDEAMNALYQEFGKRADVTNIYDFDGYRVEFAFVVVQCKKIEY